VISLPGVPFRAPVIGLTNCFQKLLQPLSAYFWRSPCEDLLHPAKSVTGFPQQNLIYPRSTFVIWRTHNHHNYFRFHSLTGVDVSSIREWRVREKSSVVKRLWLPADICHYIRRDFPNTYDALGRVRTIIHGDGSHVNYSYSGRATQVTDENGASRIIQVDGLGRPTVVCEISATSLQGDSPSACSLDITAPQAYITNYAYSTDTSAANALKLIVNQGVQTRTFLATWLRRAGRPLRVCHQCAGRPIEQRYG
jgi:hypothetical protein